MLIMLTWTWPWSKFKCCNHIHVSCAFRVCFTFGKRIKFQIQDVTPTFLSQGVISTLRQADHVAYSVINKHGKTMLVWSKRACIYLTKLHSKRFRTKRFYFIIFSHTNWQQQQLYLSPAYYNSNKQYKLTKI